jgi:hypothetical protein
MAAADQNSERKKCSTGPSGKRAPMKATNKR